MERRVLNNFYEIEGNTLISNNYNAFDVDILEIRIQTLYGERPLRHFTDSRLKIMAQNVVDMYSGYLSELFTFPEEYKILTPEFKEIARKMNYNLSHENTAIGVNKGNSSTTGSDSHDETRNEVLDSLTKLLHGLNIESNRHIDTQDEGNDTYKDNKSNTGTVVTDSDVTNNQTVNNSVSAYNQVTEMSPHDMSVTNGATTEDSTVTNNLTEVIDHNGSYGKHLVTGDTDSTIHSGTDNTTVNSTNDTTLKANGTNQSTSNSLIDSTEDEHGTETYNLDENIKETGRLNYEEIINTIENLFNPYDWLARKIVNTICEGYYYERIR